MTKEEKKAIARKILEDHGYPEEEIVEILSYAFDGKLWAEGEDLDWGAIDANRN